MTTEGAFLGADMDAGVWLGRVWRPDLGPCVATIRDGAVVDITSREAPTVRDVCEMSDPVSHVRSASGETLGSLAEIASARAGDPAQTHFLAPCDLQAVKAAGVTFASSMA